MSSYPSQSGYLMQHISDRQAVLDRPIFLYSHRKWMNSAGLPVSAVIYPYRAVFTDTFFPAVPIHLFFGSQLSFHLLQYKEGYLERGTGAAQKPVFTKHCLSWVFALHHKKLDGATSDDSTPFETRAWGSQHWHSSSTLTRVPPLCQHSYIGIKPECQRTEPDLRLHVDNSLHRMMRVCICLGAFLPSQLF